MPPDATAFEAARQAFVDGVSHYEAGRFAEAAGCFEASLARVPGRPSTLLNLGAARLKLGEAGAALAALDEALACEAGDADGHAHRAQALVLLGRDAEALAAFDRALELRPGHRAVRWQRALALLRLGRPADALPALASIAAASDGHAAGVAWMRHGQALQLLGRHAEARASYDRAVAADPALGEAWLHRGLLLKDQGDDAGAAASLRSAIARGADEALARYALAAIEGAGTPATSPAAYVRALFDPYAADFDRHLVEGLQYRAHEQVMRAVAESQPAPVGAALDLGCGTGLCGPALARQARRVVGVDLSPPMLARAAARGVYAECVEDELVGYLERSEERFDLVVAADVFIYVGDLTPVFAGVARVLEPGGIFAFSVERADERTLGTAGYELRRSLRYAHGESALRALAAANGLAVERMTPAVLRVEQGAPIDGLTVVLRRA